METAIDSKLYLKTILYAHQNIRESIVEQIADQLLESIIDKLIFNPEVRQFHVTQDMVTNAFQSYSWNALMDVFETTKIINVPDGIDVHVLKIVVDTLKDQASTGHKKYPLQSLMTQTSVLPDMGQPAFHAVMTQFEDAKYNVALIDSDMVVTF